jgi:SAM-dependent methyltransferase
MSSSTYYQQGAATRFASFFGDAKRLRLVEHLTLKLNALQQNLQRPLKMLDVGAGTAMHAAYFAQMGHAVTAVDPVEEMLAEGRKLYKLPNLNFIVDSLPLLEKLGEQRFDVIYSVAAWQYIKPEDRQSAMERIIKLLHPGGMLVIVWPVPMSREFQYPLSHENISDTIDLVNKALPENQRVNISTGIPIVDPDGRMGFIDKNTKVYFNTTIGELPTIKLRNNPQAIRAKL